MIWNGNSMTIQIQPERLMIAPFGLYGILESLHVRESELSIFGFPFARPVSNARLKCFGLRLY